MAYKRPAHLSAKGAAFIGGYEGYRSQPYNDPLGFATIGYGHLLHRSRVTEKDRVKWGVLTRVQAQKLLIQDAESFAASVRNHTKSKLNQEQFDALVSFAFNVGAGAFEKSTLLRILNTHPGTDRGVRGASAQVEEQLLRWVNKGSSAEVGLRRRRRAEARLFRTGKYS